MKILKLTLLCILVTTGCQVELSEPDTAGSSVIPASETPADQGSEVALLHFDEAVVHKGLKLYWLDIKDSRCPEGVDCVWAGEVSIELEASMVSSEEDAQKLKLTLPVRGDSTAATAFGFEFELMSVEPYPIHGVEPDRSTYVAGVKVTQVL